jgi:hypothetical protein
LVVVGIVLIEVLNAVGVLVEEVLAAVTIAAA